MTRGTLVLVMVLTSVLTACSAGPDSTPRDPSDTAQVTVAPLSTTSTTVPVEEAARRFRDCMRGEGVDVPEFGADAQGLPILSEIAEEIAPRSLEVRTALAGCALHLTETGVLDLRSDPELQEVVVSHLQAFATCMRDRGVEEFPDPSTGFDGTGPAFPPERVPWNQAAFTESVLTCQEVIDPLESR